MPNEPGPVERKVVTAEIKIHKGEQTIPAAAPGRGARVGFTAHTPDSLGVGKNLAGLNSQERENGVAGTAAVFELCTALLKKHLLAAIRKIGEN